jgi:hypothetical protein
MSNPLIINGRSGGAKQDILNPVRGRPARGGTAFNSNGPRRMTVCDHGLHERLQLRPCSRRVVAGFLPGPFGVPDQALDVDPVKNPVGSPLVSAQCFPDRRVILLDQCQHFGPEGDDLLFRGKPIHPTGLRQGGHIRWVATLHTHKDQGFELLRGRVDHINAGPLFKHLAGGFNTGRIGRLKRPKDFNDLLAPPSPHRPPAAASAGQYRKI